MNPLDDKLDQAIQDLRDATGHRMSTTRSYMLARIRRERMTRWGLGGGGLALLSIITYFIVGGTEPPSQTPPIENANTNATPANSNTENTFSKPANVSSQTRLDWQKRVNNSETTEGQQSSSSMHMTVQGDNDGFIAESTKIADDAERLVAADELVAAAQKFRGLAQFCEARAEWKRAITAYDSAMHCARRVGDNTLVASLTKAQSSASKKAANRN